MNKKLIIAFFLVTAVTVHFVLPSFTVTTEKVSQAGKTANPPNVSFMKHPASPPDASIIFNPSQNTSSDGEILILTQQIWDAMNGEDLSERDRVLNDQLLELIKKDPHAATNLAESLPVGAAREEMLRRLAQHWAEVDINSTKQWAEQLSSEQERHTALTYVCGQVAQTDPRLAVQMADQYGLEKQPGTIMADLVQQWGMQDLSSAIAWVEARPAGEGKNEMLSRCAVTLAGTSPIEAAQLVAAKIPAGSMQTEAAISVLYQWARNDLTGARAWAELFPEGPLRERALKELNGAGQNVNERIQ